MLDDNVKTTEILTHASALIKQNADELQVAFSCEDGTIPHEDKDVEYQIIDLLKTSELLLTLKANNVYSC